MRRLIRGIGALAVLFLLAVAADRVAAGYAAAQLEERLVAQRFRAPDVTIRGFPFLLQVLDKEYRSVRVQAAEVTVAAGRATDVAAELAGVEVDDVVRPSTLRLRSVRAVGTVPYDDVARASGIPTLTLGRARNGEVRLEGQLKALGDTLAVAARGRIDVRGDHLLVVPTGVTVQGAGDVDDRLSDLLAERIAIDYPIRGMPAGVVVQSITAGPRGFEVRVAGDDIVLGTQHVAGMRR